MQTILITLFCLLDPQPLTLEVTVDQTPREAIVYVPEANTSLKPEAPAAPVLFAFHGHGGNARNVARTFAFQRHWPEAIIVYPQGLATATRRDPEGKKPGWQNNAGLNDDRDLNFFDALLARLQEQHRVDKSRIYATGHSNGGGFTYLLWGKRSDVLAAVAPSAARGGRQLLREGVNPLPVLHVAGRNDPIVAFADQLDTINVVREFNGCVGEGSAWNENGSIYESNRNTPVVTFIHDGDHKYPTEAPALIVKFFKEHSRPAAKDIRPPETTPKDN